jgi:hypothetical protein
MSFELANAFATFQNYINFALKRILDVFVIYYLDDILIYFQNEEKHTNHVRFVLNRLRKYKLFAKLSKCDFDLKEVDYLKFIVEINDIRMNLARIAIVKKWVESTTRRHVRTFLKFVEFYRKFIEKFSKIIKSLTNLQRKKERRVRQRIWIHKKSANRVRTIKRCLYQNIDSVALWFETQNSIKNRRIWLRDIRNFVSIDRRNESMTFRRVFLSKDVRRKAKLWNRRSWNARRDRVVSSFSTLRRRCIVFCSNADRSR